MIVKNVILTDEQRKGFILLANSRSIWKLSILE